MSEFLFEFDYDDYFGIPTVKIFIDQQCLYQDTVKKQIVVTTELVPGAHTLTIEHFGKHAWEHQNTEHDRHIELKSIVVDGVDLDHHEHCMLTHQGRWYPDYSLECITPCHWLGNNGTWTLNFDAPVLNWIIKTINPAGVSPEQTLDRSGNDILKDTLDFFKINV
jgi:hypothetical protein